MLAGCFAGPLLGSKAVFFVYALQEVATFREVLTLGSHDYRPTFKQHIRTFLSKRFQSDRVELCHLAVLLGNELQALLQLPAFIERTWLAGGNPFSTVQCMP